MNRYQGDPAVRITEYGASMRFLGGQPVMDQGLENSVQISLFTLSGWWGNALLADANKIGSDFEEQRTIVDVQTIQDYTDAARLALQWMADNRIADKIDVTITNPTLDHIKATISIYPPGHDAMKLLFNKSGLNWIAQAVNPAHERFPEVV